MFPHCSRCTPWRTGPRCRFRWGRGGKRAARWRLDRALPCREDTESAPWCCARFPLRTRCRPWLEGRWCSVRVHRPHRRSGRSRSGRFRGCTGTEPSAPWCWSTFRLRPEYKLAAPRRPCTDPLDTAHRRSGPWRPGKFPRHSWSRSKCRSEPCSFRRRMRCTMKNPTRG